MEIQHGKSLRPTIIIDGTFLLICIAVPAFSILGTLFLKASEDKVISIGQCNTPSITWILIVPCFCAMLQVPAGNIGLSITSYTAGLIFLMGLFSAVPLYTGECSRGHPRAIGRAQIRSLGLAGRRLKESWSPRYLRPERYG